VSEIFGKEDVAESDGRGVEKLHSSAVAAEAVVDEIGEHEQGICGGPRKCHIGRAAERTRMAECIHGSEAKDLRAVIKKLPGSEIIIKIRIFR